jgi:transglutaminase-like putative cysteine protease
VNRPQITVLDQRSLDWLLGGLGLVILPHLFHMPVWMAFFAIGVGLWRALAARRGWPLPGAKLKLLLTLSIGTAIYFKYHTLLGRDSGTALLVMMMALKLVELRQRRDVLVLMFLAYFILLTHFLFSQSIPMAAYVLTVAWLLVSLHIHLGGIETRPLSHNLRTSGVMLALALPLMLVLFVLFPRVQGPLWGLPKDAYSGMTGLDDSMSPGTISQLSLSDAVAFRVKFDGAAPPAEKLYWRGPVLWAYDGRNWTAGPQLSAPGWQTPPLAKHGAVFSYTVTLEPHNRKWLFVLDLPATASEKGQISRDFQLTAMRKVRERLLYHMVSYTDYNTGNLSRVEQVLGLSLPPGRNPRTVALGRSVREQAHSESEIVRRALELFSTQPFIYSLSPPLLTSKDPSDEFLFQTRTGFCEHFASSFTLLMRAAGIPARVVTGYLGGEQNPVDDYYIVRQRDAHAWSEVWLQGRGWVRVDPTAAVAPERIERSIDTGQLAGGAAVRFNLPQSDLLASAWQRLRLNLDAINNRWNQWVLGYGPKQQADFLDKLGLDIHNWRRLGWVFLLLIGGLLAAIALFVLLPRQQKLDPVLKNYRAFCRKLARRGLQRHDNETAGAFAGRIKEQRPDLAAQVDLITALYSNLRYADIDNYRKLLQLKQLVSRFNP